MKKLMTSALLLLSSVAIADADISAQDQARQHAMLLGKSLQMELQQAMKAGGPEAAVAVCNTQAMPISTEISQQTGWQVARTSLKVRNSQNSPDAWEQEQLEQFEKRLQQGESPASLEAYALLEENGKPVERFMKAIPTQEGCLQCHGESIPENLSAQLYKLYPEDQARGFTLGQLRGAFTLSREAKLESF